MHSLLDSLKDARIKLESLERCQQERRQLHFAAFADATVCACEKLELDLMQAAYELELAKAQGRDLAAQLNAEREKSAQKYFAGVEDCRAIVSGGTVRTLDPASRVALMDKMAALKV
jgi:hypothetical protein